MSWFEVNKILASIILALIIFSVIGYIGDILINPEIPEKQAYIIDTSKDSESINNLENAKNKNILLEPISELLLFASLENGEKISKKCVSCHNFKKGDPNKIGPNLYEIVGAPVGRTVGFVYSKAMSEFGGKWGFEELANFIYKPKEYIGGTKMNFAGLKKATDRADLILWLNENADNPVPIP